ncbi:MAG: AraC family transcriptional regulator [Rhodoblastus sp.]
MAALGHACGLGDLTDPLPETIGVENFLLLFDAAANMLDDPFFGLHVGERMRVVDAGGYGMALLACPTLRDTAAITMRYERLAHDLCRCELIEQGDVGIFRIHSPWLDLKGAQQVAEFMAAYLQTINRWLLGQSLPIIHIHFKHSAPQGLPHDEYARVLDGAPVSFDAEFNEGRFPAALLDLPIPNADRSLLPQLTRLIDKRVEERGLQDESATVRVLRDTIRTQLRLGRTDLDRISAVAGLSPRTLQRRLANDGTSFTLLLDEVRREFAHDLLEDARLSFTDIALLLGFSEQSSFNHAFRRWFGVSPSQWRRRG